MEKPRAVALRLESAALALVAVGAVLRRTSRPWLCGLVMATGGLLAGCAAQSITASLPKVAPVAGEPGRIDASTTEVYSRIAAGAMRCWFAVGGQIRASHIFHANADPAANGGIVEADVLERDMAGPKPWGAKAFKVMLAPSGEQTTIDIENIKMPEATAATMRADVFAWAQGDTNCKLKPADLPPPPVAEKSKKTKAKKLVKAPAP